MRIVYFGNGVRGCICLKALLEAGKEVVAVIGHTVNPSDMINLAIKIGLQYYQPADVNHPDFIKKLRGLNPDLFILSGYNRILKANIINLPTHGCINLHGGKLPDYRGCAPINWQIVNGETIGGCCVLFVNEGIDTGAIIRQAFYEIGENETSQDIVKKQLLLFPSMLLETVKDFEAGHVQVTKQDVNKGCYYTRRYPRDGLIYWDKMTACQVFNLVRALYDPYPNAFTFFQGEKIRIRRVRRIKPSIKGIPGRIPLKMEDGIVVCCMDESILVTEAIVGDNVVPIHPCEAFKIGIDFSME